MCGLQCIIVWYSDDDGEVRVSDLTSSKEGLEAPARQVSDYGHLGRYLWKLAQVRLSVTRLEEPGPRTRCGPGLENFSGLLPAPNGR